MRTYRRRDKDTDATDAAVVDLAREAPFRLAHMLVTPATLEVAADNWSQRLEPRAMKVLVALARRDGEVVSRAELNDQAWEGRVVGDDAINRTIQILRRVGTNAPPPIPFAIKTVPRVGYRLKSTGQTARGRRSMHAPFEPRASYRMTKWRGLVIAMMIFALGSLALWLVRSFVVNRPGRWTIAQTETLDDLPPDASEVALSPDGEQVAFRARDKASSDRIYVRAVGGGVAQPLSPPSLNVRHPAWSPDGLSLAFSTYDTDRPCRLFVMRPAAIIKLVASCETEREPQIAWSADGGSLLFGDKPGQNGVLRIRSVRVKDGRRDVLTSPPGDSVGDDQPMAAGHNLLFRRRFGWADEAFVSHDLVTGRESVLWRRTNVTGTVATTTPDGGVAIGWTRAGSSHLDLLDARGNLSTEPLAMSEVSALSSAHNHMLIETDHRESALATAGMNSSGGATLATLRGTITSPVSLPDGHIRFVVASSGSARIWELDTGGAVRPWGGFAAPTIVGLAVSPDKALISALAVDGSASNIVIFDRQGKVCRRWALRARKVNPAAWRTDGRHVIVPILDNAGWRLFELDLFKQTPPRDMLLPGFAVVQSRGAALYAVRAGENTGSRELWRLDGGLRRLPFDLTLFDIVNWVPDQTGVWFPARDVGGPSLIEKNESSGAVISRLAAPGLAGPGSRLTMVGSNILYVRPSNVRADLTLITLYHTTR